jgi:hypothetical protein
LRRRQASLELALRMRGETGLRGRIDAKLKPSQMRRKYQIN